MILVTIGTVIDLVIVSVSDLTFSNMIFPSPKLTVTRDPWDLPRYNDDTA